MTNFQVFINNSDPFDDWMVDKAKKYIIMGMSTAPLLTKIGLGNHLGILPHRMARLLKLLNLEVALAEEKQRRREALNETPPLP